MTGPCDDRLVLGIVGAGRVGTSTAFAALVEGVADEITLVDVVPERAEGEAMDLAHGLPFVSPAYIRAGGFEALSDADVVVVTAGAARRPGDTRLDLARRNLEAVAGFSAQLANYAPDALLLVVSNPVDLLTLALQRLTGLPPARVIGSGTILDTARLRSALARHMCVDARNVQADVLGEHGDSQLVAWSTARVGGVPVAEFARAHGASWTDADHGRIAEEVRLAGAEVIRRKGATHFAIGLATAHLARAMLRDERGVYTVSTVLDGLLGLHDVALSLPCVVGRKGRSATLVPGLSADESRALHASADLLRRAYDESGGPPAR